MPTSRIALIYSKTLDNTWKQVLTKAQMKAILGFKVKGRFDPGAAPKSFDISFQAAPDTGDDVTDGTGFLSYTGSGFGDTLSPSNGFWARTRDPSGSSVIEIITYG